LQIVVDRHRAAIRNVRGKWRSLNRATDSDAHRRHR